jgi:hydroxypyruvate reductase
VRHPSQPHSRALLLEWLGHALRAVDGRARVRAALADPSIAAMVGEFTDVAVFAIGKAAARMTLGAYDVFGARIIRSLVVTKAGHLDAALSGQRGLTAIESAHPVPDARSLDAGARLLAAVGALGQRELPLFLVSGGASSLVEVLRPGIALDDLASLNRTMLAQGTAIGEVNARRGALSLIKGGALMVRLGGRPALALFISDVPHDDPAVIGSGLAGPVPGDNVRRHVIARNEDAVEAVRAAAAAAGHRVRVGGARFDGDAEMLGARLAAELVASGQGVIVQGGESTVRLPASPGRGGRNQQLALAAARGLRGHGERCTLLAVGTDGTDGTTDDAGALVDGESWQRIADAGLDGAESLARADAGTALEAAGDLVHTGATGTNVGDLVIGLAHMV